MLALKVVARLMGNRNWDECTSYMRNLRCRFNSRKPQKMHNQTALNFLDLAKFIEREVERSGASVHVDAL